MITLRKANESPLKIRIAIPLPRIFGLTGTAFLNSFTSATTHKESQDHAARRPPLSDISKYAPTFDTVVLPVYERLAKSHKRFHHTDSVAVARTLPNSLTSRVLTVSGCSSVQYRLSSRTNLRSPSTLKIRVPFVRTGTASPFTSSLTSAPTTNNNAY